MNFPNDPSGSRTTYPAERSNAIPNGSTVVVRETTTTPLEGPGCAVALGSPNRSDKLQVKGIVECGDQRGRLLGFPTANLAVPALKIGEGVWAGTIQIGPASEGPTYLAAVSVGRRPTYYADGQRLLEAHLLGFNGDLYGRSVLVTLHAYIRPQRRFPNTAELTLQLQNDVACVRAWGIGAGLVSPLSDATAVDRPLQSSKLRGRSYPVSQKRSKRRTNDVSHMKRERAAKRLSVLRRAVTELVSVGCPTHEAVSNLTGIPIGYLLWAYPTTESLLAIASADSLSHVTPVGDR